MKPGFNKLACISMAAGVAFYGLAVIGEGGFAAFFRHPARAACWSPAASMVSSDIPAISG